MLCMRRFEVGLQHREKDRELILDLERPLGHEAESRTVEEREETEEEGECAFHDRHSTMGDKENKEL